ncbi:MAG: T9SS C-terminal target domain-containing protein [Ignavibacteriae bacterium]|nr:MAG: T9SS C-terminal target domain-containing protein [Ignavibacteriota bacterium]
MKRILLTIFLILILYSFQNYLYSQINQEWKWVNPLPQGNSLRWVKAFSATDWIAVGNNGTFIKTSDAGATWDVYTNAGGKSPSSHQGNLLYSGWFFNANTGFICGANSWLAKTNDGGITWERVNTPIPGSHTFTGLYFVNDTVGFMSSLGKYIIKTTNGGTTWIILPTDPPWQLSGDYNCIYALDEDHVFAAMPNYISITHNGGVYFVHDSTGISSPYDIFFADPNTGIVCGSNGNFSITTNGGINWTNKPAPTTAALYKMYCVAAPAVRYSFLEDFNGDIFPPLGWKSVNEMGRLSMWFKTMQEYHSATGCAWIPNEFDDTTGNGGLDWLISPKLSINAGDSLSFWLRAERTGFAPDSLCVRVSTTDTATASFTTRVLYLAEGLNYPDTVWTKYSLSLDAFAGQNIYVAFKHREINGDGLYMDDVHLTSQSNITITAYAAGADSSVYYTTNMGDNWTAIPCIAPFQYTSSWYSMDFSGSTIVLAGNYGIFNVSTNMGATWSSKNYRASSSAFYDVWFESGIGKVWMVGAPAVSGSYFDQVLYSADGGKTFEVQNVNGSRAGYRSISMIDANNGFICGSFGSIRKTIDGGASWDSLVTSIPSTLNLYKIDFIDANTGWVFSNTTNSGGTIWNTTDGGSSWTQQTLTDTTSAGLRIYTADMVNANTGFCINGKPVVNMTTDGGVSWGVKSEVLNTSVVRDMCMIDASNGFACGNQKVFKTTDSWANFDSIAVPFNDPFYSTKWLDADNGFVASLNGVVLRTTNSGTEWDILATSSSNVYKIFATSIDTAYAVGEKGNVLKFQRGLVGTTWKGNVPEQYYLGQNYPNPFNPGTQFKFGITKRSKISLKVYDITGRLVQTFFDNMELNPGTVTAKFDGSNLASGIYFYTLFADDYRIDTKKMILLK